VVDRQRKESEEKRREARGGESRQEGARGSEKERERRGRKGSELSFSAPEADTFADTRHDHPLGVSANLSMEISRVRRGRRRLGVLPLLLPLRGIVNPRGLAT